MIVKFNRKRLRNPRVIDMNVRGMFTYALHAIYVANNFSSSSIHFEIKNTKMKGMI